MHNNHTGHAVSWIKDNVSQLVVQQSALIRMNILAAVC